ncbi:MAG: family 1 glycosylhydrolase [Erysipelotrichaceae bacterium]|nr:family 1 glycosylhydrolase [Erysipelotrichaceae bacterium]
MSEKREFLWGGALAANQCEGAYLEDGRLPSSCDLLPDAAHGRWDVMYHPCKILETDYGFYPSHEAIDFYHSYKEDLKLLAESGIKALRLSISWTRIYPNGEEETPNEKGLQFYEDLFKECLKYGMEPVVTLCHFDVPVNLIKKYGSWTNRIMIDLYAKYARTVLERYKDLVKYWLTFNEINMITHIPYLGGGLLVDKDDKNFNSIVYNAAHNQLLASAKAVEIAKEISSDLKMGCMMAAGSFYPYSCNPNDVMEAVTCNNKNYIFIDVQMNGEYSGFAKNHFKKLGVEIKMEEGDIELLKNNTCDYLGFSYYSSRLISTDPEHLKNVADGNAITTLRNPYLQITKWGRQIDPVGLRVTMNDLYSRYHKPLFIVENGLGVEDKMDEKGEIHDDYRIEYIDQHITQLKKAILEDGVECIGYLVWGIIDIISAGGGEIDKRYGLVYVDKHNDGSGDLKRYVKDSFHWYKNKIQEEKIYE